MEKNLLDILWVLLAAILVFIMQAGFAMVESGMTRSKNSINVAIKNLTDFGVSSLVFWAAGFAIMYGTSVKGLFGSTGFFFDTIGVWPFAFFLFQTMFASTSATIVSGAIAERMRFSSYVITTFILSILVYPVFGHWVWGGADLGSPTGWLGKLGFVDFAGSTVVHSVGGWASLAMLLIIGPRRGKYRSDGSVATINGSNIPMAVFGVCLLWFGWFGFNGGSTLAMNNDVPGIILRTSLGGAAGMVGALFLGWPLYRKPDINLVINGSLAGLVAITANCHAVSTLSSIVIGGIAGVIMIGTTHLLDRLRIDDAVGAIPVHLGGGIWGTLAVAFFSDPAKLGTNLAFWPQLSIQVLGIVVCGVWTFSTVWITTLLLNRFRPIRVLEEEEHDGLNKSEHGVTTEIHDLFHVLDTQAKTGNISLRAPMEPFTEAGQIAGMYNAVMDRLEENTVAKGEYVQIMRNVGDGMFLIDRNGCIGPYYSAALERLFGSKQLSGQRLENIFAKILSPENQENLKEFFELCFDTAYQWRHVEKLNPLAETEAFLENMSADFNRVYLQFAFRRIMDDAGSVERLLVLVRDVSAEKQLAEAVEETREQGRHEIDLLYRVLHVDPTALSEFLRGLRVDLNLINECFRQDEDSVTERLTRVFRLTHSIKGDAELLELDFIGEKAENLEEKVRLLRNRPQAQGEDFLSLTLLYSELNSAAEELELLAAKLQSFGSGSTVDAARGKNLPDTLAAMTVRLATRYNKQVRLFWHGVGLAVLPETIRKGIMDIIIQLVRNAIYHGIESPQIRQKMGKSIEGRIEIKIEQTIDSLSVSLRDDGSGINMDKLKNRAREAGLLPPHLETGSDNHRLMLLIFQPGLSTADGMDSIAGKGIGMALVKTRIKELGGQLSIRSKPGEGCEFRFRVPLGVREDVI